jgi:hypothetical protein
MDQERPEFAVPAFLERRPPMDLDAATQAAFDRLYDDAAHSGGLIHYRLPQPRWQFLAHIADTRDVLVHGSGNPDIAMFEPRKPDDVNAFGDQMAVYAASDALWAMYFAILDRRNHRMSMINSAARFETPEGLSEPYYFFSISRAAREANAFVPGTIYFLPRATFVQEPARGLAGRRLHVAHWASLEAVAPLAKIAVRPEDFPLLDKIRGHDDETTFAKARANPDGFPWLD